MLYFVESAGVRSAGASARAGVGPKRQEALFAQKVFAADVSVLVLSFFTAYAIRQSLWYGELLPLREFAWVLGAIVVLWPMLARSVGLAESQTYLWPRRMLLLS